MSAKSQNAKIIFGLKVKQLRQEKKLSFSELSKQAGMSVSYLNEIEKGKKYPKDEKIESLAAALDTTFKSLTDNDLNRELSPVSDLLQSNFLNELPLDLFGIELQKVVEIIANAPARVGAFISTLLELSRNYELQEENFYFATMRSYLQLHHNYFEELEKSVEQFIKENRLSGINIKSANLQRILEKKYRYKIIENGLDEHTDLQMLRSIYIPRTKKLLLNSNLTESQRTFTFGKELGFNFLSLSERANTSSLLKGRNFEEVLNHSRAIYFSTALLMNRETFLQDMRKFISSAQWNGEEFLAIMRKYDASPEMYYHRLTNIFPRFFGLKKMFFLRFLHDPASDHFEADRELHFTRVHHPHSNALQEHYCRRWIAVSLLRDLHQLQAKGEQVDHIVGAQISKYYGTDDEYLCLTIARPSYPRPNQNVSVTLGLLITDEVREKIKFLNDPAINQREVNRTCERCPIMDCKVRAVEPIKIIERDKRRRVQAALKRVMEE